MTKTIDIQQASVLFKQNYFTDKHIIVNQGGTSSGKTFAIIQVLFSIACENEKLVITVAGQDSKPQGRGFEGCQQCLLFVARVAGHGEKL